MTMQKVDEATINMTIEGEEKVTCTKEELAVNWGDRTYGPDYSYSTQYGLPSGYKALKAFYSEGPINIEKTDYSGESNKPPDIKRFTQWNQWKSGYIRTRQPCEKGDTVVWYWVDYRVELTEKEGPEPEPVIPWDKLEQYKVPIAGTIGGAALLGEIFGD